MEDKESYDELKKMSEELQNTNDQRIDSLVSTICSLSDDLNNNKPKAAIPEVVFVQHFLPYFQDFARNKETQNDSLLCKWLELANGPYNEVDVVGANGETLFTVPSIYIKNVAAIDNVKKFDFTNTVTNYNRKLNNNPVDAENYINSQMGSVPKFIHDANGNKQEQQRWIEIFKRYNKPKNEEKKDSKSNNKIKKRLREDFGIEVDE